MSRALVRSQREVKLAQESLRRLMGALKELERARLGDAIGRCVVEPGEALTEEGEVHPDLYEFIRLVAIEGHKQGFSIIAVADADGFQSAHAQRGNNGSSRRIQRGS
jgi:hypothetical protein